MVWFSGSSALAQNGHWKSENSTMVAAADGRPLAGAPSVFNSCISQELVLLPGRQRGLMRGPGESERLPGDVERWFHDLDARPVRIKQVHLPSLVVARLDLHKAWVRRPGCA